MPARSEISNKVQTVPGLAKGFAQAWLDGDLIVLADRADQIRRITDEALALAKDDLWGAFIRKGGQIKDGKLT